MASLDLAALGRVPAADTVMVNLNPAKQKLSRLQLDLDGPRSATKVTNP